MTASEISELVGAQLERLTEGDRTIGYVLVLAELGSDGKIARLRVGTNVGGLGEVSKLLDVAAEQIAAGPRAG